MNTMEIKIIHAHNHFVFNVKICVLFDKKITMLH